MKIAAIGPLDRILPALSVAGIAAEACPADADLSGYDALVLAASDPTGLSDETLDPETAEQVLRAAASAGVSRIICLTSHEIYGSKSPGARFSETSSLAPDTPEGQRALAVEAALSRAGQATMTVSLRIAPVYGPGPANPWAGLLRDFHTGRMVASDVSTALNVADLAEALRIVLHAPADEVEGPALNVSDLLIERRDLLAAYSSVTGRRGVLPPLSDIRTVNVPAMDSSRMRAMGWRPGGWSRLRETLPLLMTDEG